ncbi:biotin-dependent carboxyltransferase family protein [Limimaricola pyoseonensis]|uniref:Allophanate hydrolase n=1 Tax=Limimaricola pyoseonensis TaxID=521013 RepID=A0A1G7FQN4_9RHOB|nr:biotin-dependent carboxyltransferase family protein [Limimaricola pyoseonensis]SDE77975.1 allophanate hydrolase [Limimaricola pyoseonensis]
MSARLVLTRAGARSLLQDTGFRGGRGTGVPAAGALDRDALYLLNRLLGNAPDAAAIEAALMPPALRAEGGAVRLALGPGLAGQVSGDNPRPVGAWTAFTLHPGETLALKLDPGCPVALIGIGGAIALPRALGSHATLARAGLGPFGRALGDGDAIPLEAAATDPGDTTFAAPPSPATGPIRAVPGPQAEWFTEDAMATFFGTDYTVGAETDRMGMRLEGPKLAHSERGADIVSDGIAPGAVQVPGSGQPIVLLADAQTTGGYPKIATVIGADLPRLARLAPGDSLRFEAVTVEQAEDAARARRAELDRIAQAIVPANAGRIDPRALWRANLAGQAVDALCPDHFAAHPEPEDRP